MAFEHQVFLELRAYLDYKRIDAEMTFWRTHSGYEVDFVVEGRVAIEVKSSRRVSAADLRGLRALAEEARLPHRIVVSMEPHERTTDDGIRILPVAVFLRELWEGTLIDR
jgi:predicted AAA+ superfamily ATPase